MNESHSRAIVFLLAAILCVMLFGAGAVLSGFGWMAGIGLVLGIVFVGVAVIAKFIGSFRDEVVAAKSKREPWLWLFVVWPAIIGNFIVCGIAALRWWGGNISFKDALGEVPYFWVPVALLFGAMGVSAIESAPTWLPEVPSKVKAGVRGWLMLVGAPVLAPMGRLRSIREARGRGERIGLVSTGLSVAGSFMVSMVVFFLAVLFPFVLVVVIASGFL